VQSLCTESQEIVKALDQFKTGVEMENFMKQEMKKRFPEEFYINKRIVITGQTDTAIKQRG